MSGDDPIVFPRDRRPLRFFRNTVELQGYFRVADGYFAADHTSFWGAKVG